MNSSLTISDLEGLLAIIGAPVLLALIGVVFGWHYRRRVEAAMRISRQEKTAKPPTIPAFTQGTTPTWMALSELEDASASVGSAHTRERPLRLALLAACVLHFVLLLFGISTASPDARLLIYFLMSSELLLSLLLLRASRLQWASAALAYAAFGFVTFPQIRSVSHLLMFLNAGQAAFYPAIGGLLLLLRPIRTIVLLLLGFMAFFLAQTAIVAVIILIVNLAGHEVITPSSISLAVTEAQHGLLLLALLIQFASGFIFFWILRQDSPRGPVLGLCLLVFSGILALFIAKLLHRGVPIYVQGTMLGIPLVVLMWFLAWTCLQGLYRLRQQQWLASEYDRSSFVWAYFSLIAWGFLGTSTGALVAAMAFPVAVIVQRALVWRYWLENRGSVGKRLVFLRVFGKPGRAIRLLELLRSPWRLIGSVDLILGTDIATFDVSPAALEAYLKGHFDAAYLQTRDDVNHRLAGLDRRLGGDGYYPIHQLRCFDSTWEYTVVKLIPGADAVLMDLRGFNESNRGCIFELTQLVNLIDLKRVLFLVDRRTDRNVLSCVFERAWADLRDGSPNIGMLDPVLNVVSDHRALSSHLLRIAIG
jgi:hypothetical protein